MGLFKKEKTPEQILAKQLKEEKKQLKEQQRRIKEEKNASFEGVLLSGIASISTRAEIELSLDPDKKVLLIKEDDEIRATLPYDRIVGFRVDRLEDYQHNSKTHMSDVIMSNIIPGKVGKISKLASSVIAEKRPKKFNWIGTLLFNGKDGITQEISIHDTDNDKEENEEPSYQAENFRDIIGRIAREYGNGVTDL